MSILILGGDNIDPIRKTLMSLGVDDIIHWSERVNKQRQRSKALPSHINMVVMLTNFLNHNSMKYYKAQAKARKLTTIYATRNIECVKSAFIQAVNNLDKDSQTYKQCKDFTQYNRKVQ